MHINYTCIKYPLFKQIYGAAARLMPGGKMDIQAGDILTMKKLHPCGEKRWLVLRTGADLGLRCLGCGHQVMTPRHKVQKNIRSIQSRDNPSTK